MGEVLAGSAHFPDAFVGLAPVALEVFHKRGADGAQTWAGWHALKARLEHHIRYFAVDIELELRGGGMADPHRTGLFEARQPRLFPLGQASFPADPVHDLHLLGA